MLGLDERLCVEPVKKKITAHNRPLLGYISASMHCAQYVVHRSMTHEHEHIYFHAECSAAKGDSGTDNSMYT